MRQEAVIHLNAAFRSDIRWWHLFLDTWNGIGMMDNPADSVTSFNLYTDVSGILVVELGVELSGFYYLVGTQWASGQLRPKKWFWWC